ncbi:ATP phosphoribosyltransferase [Elizabethkingia argentiflava]|uniref:ATP phosphoribosyltransferase n=1 Tax=Elizabethkingia argenteiflava TaxID=2681556 RepID=A0A845PV64_9FLAO|nr:ATP phosphoribosyltransferase [Elizabethkingia argenteiflava]NAW50871.1 ATP phosphoribosyltransferase [Elizabethkingia argenteiflava]
MKLKIAIQKNGRLSEKSLHLLAECGIDISNENRILKAIAKNFPLEILFLRDDDIPQYVEQGVADIGILGENEVLEKNRKIDILYRLGFASCKLCLAIPKDENYPGLSYFEGKKIATSYPMILNNFFQKHQINVQIEEIGGSVEIAPNIGISHAIFDIVSTGSTLLTNGLKPVETVLTSEAVLVARKNLSEKQKKILDQLIFRIKAVHNSAQNKYILLNAPNDKLDKIIKILPGMRAPTLLPLATPGWSSVHSVIQEDTFWEIIEQLRNLGAEGILILEIEKMIL